MIFSTSLPRFKAFLGDYSGKASDFSCCLLLLSSFLLPAGRRSVAAAAGSVLSDVREASWLLRWLGSSPAPAALCAAAQFQLQTLARDAVGRLHVLVLDSTCHSQQGQYTCNTFSTGNTKKRPAHSQRQQKKVARKSSHCFVFALLLTPNGLRIPSYLPFYTKGYGNLFGWRHRSQADLAAQLLDSIPVAKNSPVVVVGDTAQGGVKVQKVLISNALTASTEELLRWYSLRWQSDPPPLSPAGRGETCGTPA